VLDDLAGLITLVQASVIEIHPWGSTFSRLEEPDRLIFDLDPGEDVPWSAVIEAAHEVRARLDDVGLVSFVKTSGGKGLHVVVPITPGAGWDAAKAFTKSIADAMAKQKPDRYLAFMTKKARRGRTLFAARIAGRLGVNAARLGRIVGRNSPRSLQDRQPAPAAGCAQAGSVARDRQGQTEAPGRINAFEGVHSMTLSARSENDRSAG
jgi:hypothetical protein